MNFYKRHLGDYAKDTKTLTTYEHGVYTLLLDFYYSEECPITAADAEALCRPSSAKESASVAKVLGRYFKADGDNFRHNYADKVIEEAKEKSNKAANSASRRWVKPDANAMPTQCQRNANAAETHDERNASHKPLATSQEKEESKTRAAPPALPDWLPPAVWDDWHKFRNARKGWTPKARALSLAKLGRLYADGHDPQAVIEQSIERGWTGLFPVHSVIAVTAKPWAKPEPVCNPLGVSPVKPAEELESPEEAARKAAEHWRQFA